MELTKHRKVLIGVVALGGAALVMDRFVLGTDAGQPAAASAAEALSAAAPASAAQANAVAGRATLAERLEQASLIREGAIADGFAPPAVLVRAAVAPPTQAADGKPASPLADVRLTTVFLGRRSVAVINGRSMVAGDVLKDSKGDPLFTLVSVDKQGVVIEQSGVRMRVDLASQPADPSAVVVEPRQTPARGGE